MLKYIVAQIAGRQYKIEPGKIVKVDFLGESNKLECGQVLLKAEDDLVSVGNPFLNEKVIFDVINSFEEPKVRVATYKAKANTRKVKGSRRKVSQIKLLV